MRFMPQAGFNGRPLPRASRNGCVAVPCRCPTSEDEIRGDMFASKSGDMFASKKRPGPLRTGPSLGRRAHAGPLYLAIFERRDNVQKLEQVFRPPLRMGFEPHSSPAMRCELGGVGEKPWSIRSGNAPICSYNFRKSVEVAVGDAICTIK